MPSSEISASILSCNLLYLKDYLDTLTRKFIQRIHIDIMDGHFVPNISFGAPIMDSLSDYVCDIHLMTNKPCIFLEKCTAKNVKSVTLHMGYENAWNDFLTFKKLCPQKVGIAISPSDSLSSIEPYLKYISHVTIMTVQPGFGGQKFMHCRLPVIELLNKKRKGGAFLIHVDGGLNNENIPLCLEAGADVLVCGSYMSNPLSLSEKKIDILKKILVKKENKL